MKLRRQSEDENIVAFLLDQLGYVCVNLRPTFFRNAFSYILYNVILR